jgi:hypothetical protein
MSIDIMRRTGGWVVELAVPIKHGSATIDTIEIRPPTIDTVVRWGEGGFPSSMALLADLSGVPERVLRQISYPDADRVMMALYNIVPQQLKTDFTSGNGRPLATPADELPPEEPGARPVDQTDPRFPADPMVRPTVIRRPEPVDGPGMSLDMPAPAARQVS